MEGAAGARVLGSAAEVVGTSVGLGAALVLTTRVVVVGIGLGVGIGIELVSGSAVLDGLPQGHQPPPRLAVTVTCAVSITTLVTRYRSSSTGLARAEETSNEAMIVADFMLAR